MIRTIIFDLDGTIIDSEPMALRAILDCTKEWGIPVTHEQAASVAGKKWEVAFDLLYQLFPMPFPMDEASRRIVKRYQELVRGHVEPVPGAIEAIKNFSASGFALALVSGSIREDVLWALRRFDVENYFKVVLGAEDYRESKPSPEGYLKALSILGAEASEAVVLEDSAAGIASGLAAGCKVVAIECTNHFGHDQRPAHARIRDFRGVDANWVRSTFP